jgi:glycosyltransferase involved in cell wall biosynthesis
MGGLEKLLVEFARHTDRNRYELHFVSLNGPGVVAGEIRDLGWEVTALELRPGFRPALVFRLARLFHSLKADIVHTHNIRPLLFAGAAARLAGVRRVVHTRHGQHHGYPRRVLSANRLASMTADHVVCVSSDGAKLAAAEGIAPGKIRTQLNGIDPTRFRPAAVDGGPVVAVGRFSPEKDFATLVRAAALAARQEPTFRLEIAGDGACLEDLKRLIVESRLDGVVKLLGQVRDIPSLLARGSIFAQSSITEGISLTILEAMATGLPVVATRVGGNTEIVADGETGLLVPPSDPAALAAGLLALWRAPERRRVMGAAGRAHVEAVFDVRKMVAAYEELYDGDRRPQGREKPAAAAVRSPVGATGNLR